MTTDPAVPAAHPLVVQHNALVNARFDLNTTEAHLFLAMLARIKRDDAPFVKCELSAREILDQADACKKPRRACTLQLPS